LEFRRFSLISFHIASPWRTGLVFYDSIHEAPVPTLPPEPGVAPRLNVPSISKTVVLLLRDTITTNQRLKYFMIATISLEDVEELIRKGDFAALRETLEDLPPADVADLLTHLSPHEQVAAFRILPHKHATRVFEYLGGTAQAQLLRAMGSEENCRLISEMSPDDRTRLLEELPSAAVNNLLHLLSPKERDVARTLLGYPEHSVGRLMTPDFIAVHDDWTIQDVLDYVREHGSDSETLNVIYVVDEKGKLIDDVRIREFLIRPVTTKVVDVRDDKFVALKVTDSENDAVDIFRKYDRNNLPVVDSQGMLVGIVTIDDVLDVAEAETTREIQKIGGMSGKRKWRRNRRLHHH
jgi:magnesium transporter